MKCNTPIDPETKMALEGEALEAALKDPASPRCGCELYADDIFCPSCGVRTANMGIARLGNVVRTLIGNSVSAGVTNFTNFFLEWMSFSGRVSRKNFGQKIGVLLAAIALVFAVGATCERIRFPCLVLGLIIGLSFFSVLARRFHDHGMSAWNGIVTLIISIVLLPIYLICLGCYRGDSMANRYGLCPIGNGAKGFEEDYKSKFPRFADLLFETSLILMAIFGILARIA